MFMVNSICLSRHFLIQTIMAESDKMDEKLLYSAVFNYLNSQIYTDSADKWKRKGPKKVPKIFRKGPEQVPKRSRKGPKKVPKGPKNIPKRSREGPEKVPKMAYFLDPKFHLTISLGYYYLSAESKFEGGTKSAMLDNFC